MKIVLVFILLLLILLPIVIAGSSVDFGRISSRDRRTFDKILKPVIKIYNLIKYTATAIAGIMGVFAGVTYILSGNDPRKREQAKQMVTYLLIGLAIIWAAPYVVKFVID